MNLCECGRNLKTEADLGRGYCFHCHVSSVTFGFRGVTQGKSAWNDSTIRETQRYYEDLPAFKEGKIEKVPERKELI